MVTKKFHELFPFQKAEILVSEERGGWVTLATFVITNTNHSW